MWDSLVLTLPNPRAFCVRNTVLRIKANALSLGSF